MNTLEYYSELILVPTTSDVDAFYHCGASDTSKPHQQTQERHWVLM